MTKNTNSESIQKSTKKHTSKTQNFVENAKKAVRNVLIGTGIMAESLGPVATTSSIPTTINTITAVSPAISTATKAITLGTATSLLNACVEKDNVIEDTLPPTINIPQTSIDITLGETIRIEGNILLIGNQPIASRKDNVSQNCTVKLFFNKKPISSGDTIDEEGTLTIQVSDESGNTKNASINLTTIKNTPTTNITHEKINILGGTTVSINNNQLLLGDEVIASRNDENIESCKVALSFNGQEIKPGDTIDNAGALTVTITNKYGKSSTINIIITNDTIFGIENLEGTTMHVDQPINLLQGITIADGLELVKTQIQIDDEIQKIDNPHSYTPEYPGTCTIIFTLKGENGNTVDINVDNITITPLEYNSIEVKNLQPKEILPIVGQIELGDKNAYKHIEHLRIAEATKIRDMMWTYGAGNRTPEEYQELMNRLNTGMLLENPLGYNNYESICGKISQEPSEHAHDERDILNTLINHANFKVINPNSDRIQPLQNYLDEHPNNINIFGCSAYATFDKEKYMQKANDKVKQLCTSKNYLLFVAGSNITKRNGTILNKIYHEDMDADALGVYGLPSTTNGQNDNTVDKHLIVTIGTDADGNIDQTNEKYETSRFPVGFHNDVLFAGREFPAYDLSTGKIVATEGKYPTSYVNYTNVAIADLCFQMFAEVEDVDQLLDMIRSSTDLRDHIRFDLNGDGDTDDIYDGQPETQNLILMNPAGFFKKYLMPNDLPSSIESSEILELKKGYYKGVIFDIPGAEVNINGQWIPYNKQNESLIKNQNPMTLEWRLNGDLCRKLGYKGQTIKGKIIVVDDNWNGLNIDKDISINIQ